MLKIEKSLKRKKQLVKSTNSVERNIYISSRNGIIGVYCHDGQGGPGQSYSDFVTEKMWDGVWKLDY